MSIKQRLIDAKNRMFGWITKAARSIKTRWRKFSPGFRYALIYFVSVICIASVVWWQFNPGNSLVFVPGENEPPAVDTQEPQDPSDDPGQVPEDPALPDEGSRSPQQVFNPDADKLNMPLAGTVLTKFGEPFSRGWYSIAEAIHIDGTRGDRVSAAWRGKVVKVVQPAPLQPGEVWIEHGEWQTVYKNITSIQVSEGQAVIQGQIIGELAADLWSTYTGDHLEFALWDANGPVDPLSYIQRISNGEDQQ